VAFKAPIDHDVLNIFIGFDNRQPVAFTALMMSIIEFSTKPVAIHPLVIQQLPITNTGLTPFTFTRFLVPWLMGYEGRALFIDTDTLFLADPAPLFGLDPNHNCAVLVADLPWEYAFERASVMLFNCGHRDNAILTPQFAQERRSTMIDWTEKIGYFPDVWNHLVGYLPPNADARLAHFTQGLPTFDETRGSEHGALWFRSCQMAMGTLKWSELMSQSVHTKTLPDGRQVAKLYDPNAEKIGEDMSKHSKRPEKDTNVPRKPRARTKAGRKQRRRTVKAKT